MGRKTADDTTGEPLFTAESNREAHAVAVEAMLVRNSPMRTNDELVYEELRTSPGFREEWNRTARGRSVAVAMVRFRAEHELTQKDLAERLGLTPLEVADLETGDVDPEPDALDRLATRFGCPFRGFRSDPCGFSAMRASTSGRTR